MPTTASSVDGAIISRPSVVVVVIIRTPLRNLPSLNVIFLAWRALLLLLLSPLLLLMIHTKQRLAGLPQLGKQGVPSKDRQNGGCWANIGAGGGHCARPSVMQNSM